MREDYKPKYIYIERKHTQDNAWIIHRINQNM